MKKLEVILFAKITYEKITLSQFLKCFRQTVKKNVCQYFLFFIIVFREILMRRRRILYISQHED